MAQAKKITLPLTDEALKDLKAGDNRLLYLVGDVTWYLVFPSW